MNTSRDEKEVVVSDDSSDEDSSSDNSSDESYSSEESCIDEEVATTVAENGKESETEEGVHVVGDEDEMVFEDSECSESSGISSSDSESSSDDSDNSSDRKKEKNNKRRSTLAHGETMALRKLRMLLLLVLLTIMLLCTIGAYFFSLNKDVSAFHADFTNVGLEVISTFQENGQQKLQALDSLSAVATAYALDHNDEWPMVTIAHSAPLLERYLKLTGAACLNILPVVPPISDRSGKTIR